MPFPARVPRARRPSRHHRPSLAERGMAPGASFSAPATAAGRHPQEMASGGSGPRRSSSATAAAAMISRHRPARPARKGVGAAKHRGSRRSRRSRPRRRVTSSAFHPASARSGPGPKAVSVKPICAVADTKAGLGQIPRYPLNAHRASAPRPGIGISGNILQGARFATWLTGSIKHRRQRGAPVRRAGCGAAAPDALFARKFFETGPAPPHRRASICRSAPSVIRLMTVQTRDRLEPRGSRRYRPPHKQSPRGRGRSAPPSRAPRHPAGECH